MFVLIIVIPYYMVRTWTPAEGGAKVGGRPPPPPGKSGIFYGGLFATFSPLWGLFSPYGGLFCLYGGGHYFGLPPPPLTEIAVGAHGCA